jgi:hypothetical protein
MGMSYKLSLVSMSLSMRMSGVVKRGNAGRRRPIGGDGSGESKDPNGRVRANPIDVTHLFPVGCVMRPQYEAAITSHCYRAIPLLYPPARPPSSPRFTVTFPFQSFPCFENTPLVYLGLPLSYPTLDRWPTVKPNGDQRRAPLGRILGYSIPLGLGPAWLLHDRIRSL